MPGIERTRPGPEHIEHAKALAALPRERLVAAIAAALASQATGPSTGPAIPDLPGARTLVAMLRGRVSERVGQGHPGHVLLDHSALACPGLPWHVAVDGDPILEGRHARAVPCAVVVALVDSGWFEPVPGRDARLRATVAGAEALGTREPSVQGDPRPQAGLRRIPRSPKSGRIAA